MGATANAVEGIPHPLPVEHGRDEQPPRKRHHARATGSKIVGLLLVPIVAGVLSYFLVRSSSYARLGDPAWIRAGSQVYLDADSDCRILIYGDSTAVTGLDPRVIAHETGLSTCNISQTKGTIAVLGTSALDLYFRRHKRPDYLVIQFSGADFYRATKWEHASGYMEGGIELIRYYPPAEFFSIIPRHPEVLIGMMRYAYVTAPANWWRNLRQPPHFQTGPETPINVHFVLPEPAYTSCEQVVDMDAIFHKPDATFISWLRNHYGQSADHVILDVAPTSPCNPRAAYLRATLTGLDSPLEQYPVGYFNEGWNHYTKAGSEHLSRQVARQISSVGNAISSRSSLLPSLQGSEGR